MTSLTTSSLSNFDLFFLVIFYLFDNYQKIYVPVCSDYHNDRLNTSRIHLIFTLWCTNNIIVRPYLNNTSSGFKYHVYSSILYLSLIICQNTVLCMSIILLLYAGACAGTNFICQTSSTSIPHFYESSDPFPSNSGTPYALRRAARGIFYDHKWYCNNNGYTSGKPL